MKKHSLIFVSLMTLFCICFTSCEKGTESMLRGTWKEVVLTSNEKSKIKEMTLYLNGAGKFTWTIVDNETRIIKGEYRIDGPKLTENEIYFSHSDMSMGGAYDFNSNPPVLYNMCMIDTNATVYQNLKFEKQ